MGRFQWTFILIYVSSILSACRADYIRRTVQMNGDVVLECTSPGSIQRTLWKKDLMLFKGTRRLAAHSRTQLQATDSGTYNLMLTNVNMSDDGLYSCISLSPTYTVVETVRLLVTGIAPTIIGNSRESLHVDENEQVTMTCNATGYPEPNYQWFKLYDGEQEYIHSGSQLTFDSILSEEAGEYQCVARNNDGSDYKTVVVYVSYGPRLATPLETHWIEMGENITIHCFINVYPIESVELAWLFQGKNVSRAHGFETELIRDGIGEFTYALTISQLSDEKYGEYVCLAKSPRTTKQISIVINKLEPAAIDRNSSSASRVVAWVGGEVTLVCIAEGTPMPTIEWSLTNTEGDEKVLANGSTLNFTNVTDEDSGHYKCTAYNDDSDSYIIELIVTTTPDIDTAPLTINATSGETIVLPCFISNLGRNSVMWADTFEQALFYDNKKTTMYPRFSLERKFENDWSMTIQNVKDDDAGTYTCGILSQFSTLRKTVTLNVYMAPVLVKHMSSSNDTVTEGSTLNLRCVFKGSPQPTISWYRYTTDSSGIRTREALGSNGGVLQVPNVDRFLGREYECIGDNGINPPARGTVHVNVAFPPEVQIEVTEQESQPGENVVFMCLVSAFPAPQIVWFKDSLAVSSTNNIQINQEKDENFMYRSIMTIENVGFEHSGNYSCVAYNNLGEQTSMGLLFVLDKPQLIGHSPSGFYDERSSLTLWCNMTGQPEPEIIWQFKPFKQDTFQDIEMKGNKLYIPKVLKKNMGSYRCIGQNNVGTTEAVMKILVQYAPEIMDTSPASYTVEIGSDVNISCVATGSPSPHMAWRKVSENKTITDSMKAMALSEFKSKGILEMKNIQENDFGEYECQSFNILGKASRIFTVLKKILKTTTTSKPSTTQLATIKTTKTTTTRKPSTSQITAIKTTSVTTDVIIASTKQIINEELMTSDSGSNNAPSDLEATSTSLKENTIVNNRDVVQASSQENGANRQTQAFFCLNLFLLCSVFLTFV